MAADAEAPKAEPVITEVKPEAAGVTPAAAEPAAKADEPQALGPTTSPRHKPKDAKAGKAAKAGKEAGKEDAPAVDLKPATASREDNLQYDLKHLAAYDISPLHEKMNFLAYTRDSVQLLVNKVFGLKRRKLDTGVVAELPKEELFKLPRQKPVPKEKPKTRWEKFAEAKGIKKKKRSRLVFDEVSGDWKPRWGYKSIKHSQASTQVVHEVRDGDDPNANPFERKAAEKKLLMARQKMREVRNQVESLGGKLKASAPELSGFKRGKEGLKEAVRRAQGSTASKGKFDRVAPNEATNLQKQKKKLIQGTPDEEKQKYLKVSTRLLTKDGGIDSAKAAKAGARDLANPRKKEKVKGVKGMPGKGRRSKQGAMAGKKRR